MSFTKNGANQRSILSVYGPWLSIPSYFVFYCVTVCYCITADQTLSLHFFQGGSVSLDFFMMMLGSKKNSLVSSLPCTLIITFIINLIINLQIYRTTSLYTPLISDTNLDRRGCQPASKLRKEFAKHIYCKNLLWFLIIIYSMGVQVRVPPSPPQFSNAG